jgi:hypothetical protein
VEGAEAIDEFALGGDGLALALFLGKRPACTHMCPSARREKQGRHRTALLNGWLTGFSQPQITDSSILISRDARLTAVTPYVVFRSSPGSDVEWDGEAVEGGTILAARETRRAT